MSVNQLTSPCLEPEQARRLLVAVEHLGIETNRIEVVTAPAATMVETSRVDNSSLARPAQRSLLGLVVGAVVGVVVGLLVVGLTDARTGMALIGFAIGGAAIGGLAGLYSRLPMSTEISDVDAGNGSVLRIDVEGLDEKTVSAIDRLIGNA